ncbi:hypothetical protein T484DRAFT_1641989, partial [Baffinella frigidus]
TLHPTPYTLHPTPCTLHPTPYTMHPAPCTLHTLHPAPCTLRPTWGWTAAGLSSTTFRMRMERTVAFGMLSTATACSMFAIACRVCG